MENQNLSNRLTYLTLASAGIGFAAYTLHPLLIGLFFLILIIPKYYPFQPHSLTTIASITFTTLIFGIIDGYTFLALQAYLQGQQSYPPVFSIYLSLMTIYHYFEFQLVNNFHYGTLAWHSFLIYHSRPYFLANMFSLAEHLVARYFFQFSYKIQHPFMLVALIISSLGQFLRIAAFFTCKTNFTHVVKFRKERSHQLITHGIYSFFRHPSYTGYFYFSVFSQIFLGNILSSVLFFAALAKFFNDRIDFEEQALLTFFPEYLEYKKKTHILIPFVKDPNFYEKYASANAEEKDNDEEQEE